MVPLFQKACIAGVERVSAWADLLDAINVFPVADGDTGRNLAAGLAPLRVLDADREGMSRKLLLAARGNSGNIACRFISVFLQIDALENLREAAERGRDEAWKAVRDPQPGTMLTVFDALVEVLTESSFPFIASLGKDGRMAKTLLLEAWGKKTMTRLEEAVRSTPDLLPRLRQAGVVDAGALGMFLYFEGFFHTLLGMTNAFRSILRVFKDQLQVSESFQGHSESGYCIDAVLKPGEASEETLRSLAAIGDSVVVTRNDDFLKIHLHTPDREAVRRRLVELGTVLAWKDDDLERQTGDFEHRQRKQAIHIMTDAAGSVTRENARKLGITLLNSYITSNGTCLPETHFQPSDIYAGMRAGRKTATSQASIFERHQLYDSVVSRFGRVLYLCVGSVYTGNYETATAWKMENDRDDRLLILDTAAASGRLGLVAIACARLTLQTEDPDRVIRFARQAIANCQEYIFPEKLQYLAAGGRLSRTSAFFGDALRMKPVISPMAEGAKKVGVVRNHGEQIAFACDQLDRALGTDGKAMILLEYSDNRKWLEEIVTPGIAGRYPRTEIILQPLSLTTGVHTGPGTWAMAFLPEINSEGQRGNFHVSDAPAA